MESQARREKITKGKKKKKKIKGFLFVCFLVKRFQKETSGSLQSMKAFPST